MRKVFNNSGFNFSVSKKNNSFQKRLRNFNNLKKLIFPMISDDKISQLMIDNESGKYITFHNVAQEITNVIIDNLSDFPPPSQHDVENWNALNNIDRANKLVMTEMTAGVGGNVLNFSMYFSYVNAIEIDKTRYLYLNQNIKTYGITNVNTYWNDSIKLLVNSNDLAQDIIFFDPPWGGKDYKLYDKLKLTFSGIAIETVCQKLFEKERNKMIIMKLPNNYDFDWLCGELSEFIIKKYQIDRMTIVVIKRE